MQFVVGRKGFLKYVSKLLADAGFDSGVERGVEPCDVSGSFPFWLVFFCWGIV